MKDVKDENFFSLNGIWTAYLLSGKHCQMWWTVQAKMLLYADNRLDYTKTIHIILKMLKNEHWLFKNWLFKDN